MSDYDKWCDLILENVLSKNLEQENEMTNHEIPKETKTIPPVFVNKEERSSFTKRKKSERPPVPLRDQAESAIDLVASLRSHITSANNIARQLGEQKFTITFVTNVTKDRMTCTIVRVREERYDV